MAIFICVFLLVVVYSRQLQRAKLLKELKAITEQIQSATLSEDIYDLTKISYRLINDLKRL